MDINKVFPKPPGFEEEERRRREEEEERKEREEMEKVLLLGTSIPQTPSMQQIILAQIG